MAMNALVEPDVVRDVTGISDSYDIDDNALTRLILYAQKQAINTIFRKHKDEEPDPNPDTGEGFDGDNTTFRSKHYPIADITLDETVDSDDISGYWIDEDWGVNDCSITVTNARFGILTITQSDGSTAIPNTTEGVYITYYEEPPAFDREVFIQAICYLTAHAAEMLMKGQNKITIHDLERNQELVRRSSGHFLALYEQTAATIGFPSVCHS